MYAVPGPPQVAAAFVLQHLLSIPAQAAAFAAATGPWSIEIGSLDNAQLSCDLAPGLYPARIGFLSMQSAPTSPERRIEEARTAYRILGSEIASRYDVGVRMSRRQRLGMVDDVWEMALRETRAATGAGWGPTVQRRSCCLIYALPGCHECAGCPRLARGRTLSP